MPTAHIEAKKEDIAKTVLMPGDPLRAKYIADNFLKDVKIVNKVRNMYAYTGYYKDSCELMMFRPPTIADYKKERESHRLVTINSDKWNKNQEILYNLLKDVKVLDADFKLFVKDFMETIEYE